MREYQSKIFSGKVALVTGGSRGIGRAISLDLAAHGTDIAISYLRNDAAAGLTAQNVRRLGRKILAVKMNLREVEDIRLLFRKIKERYGRLDYLIHCAAVGIFRPILELNSIQIDHVLEANVKAFVLCAQEASKVMRKGGKIIALSSLGSHRYFEDYGSMGMAKASVEAAVRYLAVELAGKGIQVNAVSAGPVDTDSIKAFSSYERRRAETIALTPTRRIAVPDDIAGIITFLCTPKSGWITGQTILADGGLSLPVTKC